MKPNIFMSYSRREVGFVDDLTHRLEKAGFKVWLDYRNLIPGTPWAGQIDKGLDESQVIVLVVSQASIASQYVELEWRRILGEKDKRIILAIFEAVELPPELEKFEWVDFRGNYEAGIKELTSQLEAPIQEEHPVPQTGFKMPPVVWASIAASVMTGFLSLFAFWSVLLPFILIPLPYRIYKRNFNFVQVQAALWLLPAGIYLLSDSTPPYLLSDSTVLASVLSFLVISPLLFLLRSAGMQRWGKPEATMAKFSNPYRPNNPNPKPVTFFIDHAAPDRRIAKDLTKTLVKYGHPQAADIKSAQAVFVLVSTYKTDSDADPEKQVVFPVLVQTVMPAEKLSHVQWIDFRRGVRNLDAIAQLLPEPAKLLSALGVRPTGNQLVLPPIIQSMIFLLVVTMASTIGAYLSETFTSIMNVSNFEELHLFSRFITVSFAVWLMYRMIKGISTRRGWLASLIGSVISYVVLFMPLWSLIRFYISDDGARSLLSRTVLFEIYGIGGVILGLLALTFSRKDYLNWFPWFPARVK